MSDKPPTIVVAGHICLDIILGLDAGAGDLTSLIVPGKLLNVTGTVIATGGAVSNTGGALHRLGLDVRLMGKIGADPLGAAVAALLRQTGPCLADGMIVSEADETSCTVVINPPGVDRVFLHCPGANNTFRADDIDYDAVADAGLFHFGYPPLMEAMHTGGGDELAAMLARARAAGAVTSLDMALPDPASPAGQADWPAILAAALPHVDIFAPSLDEILYMLDPAALDRLRSCEADLAELTSSIAARLIDMGPAIALVKLGDAGVYLHTAADPARVEGIVERFGARGEDWADKAIYAPCFRADVQGTTGAGDCTIAGLLAAIVKGLPAADAVTAAVAVGGCNVEAPDATSGVKTWDDTWRRIRGGWDRQEPHAAFS